MQEQSLGFDKEHVVTVDLSRVPSKFRINFIEELKKQSAVESVSFTNAVPGRPGWQGQWAYDEELGEDAPVVDSEYMSVDENYIDVLGLELIAGRNFSPDRAADRDDALIINETLVREMNWGTPENALGKRITSPSRTPAGEVIGVVKDYHEQGLQDEIWPQAMDYDPRWSRYAAISYGNADVTDLMDQTRAAFDQTVGDYTFEYFFLDQEFDKQYRSEERLMRVFIIFTVLTIAIAVIGLLGLVSFMVISRMREISIRKVLGANEATLVTLLSREFTFLVLLSNLIVIPIIWILGRSWLEDFAYHGSINPMIFVYALLISVILALLVVGIQVFLAARRDPVKVLRSL
jgi:putative ABC transport system permease protein